MAMPVMPPKIGRTIALGAELVRSQNQVGKLATRPYCGFRLGLVCKSGANRKKLSKYPSRPLICASDFGCYLGRHYTKTAQPLAGAAQNRFAPAASGLAAASLRALGPSLAQSWYSQAPSPCGGRPL